MSDSVSMIRRHMTTGEAKRVVECGVETLRLLMDHYTPLEKLVEPDLRARLEKLGLGSAVVEVRPGTDEKGARCVDLLVFEAGTLKTGIQAEKQAHSADLASGSLGTAHDREEGEGVRSPFALCFRTIQLDEAQRAFLSCLRLRHHDLSTT